jgi:hypothetical protein
MSTFIPLTVHDVHWGPTLDYALQSDYSRTNPPFGTMHLVMLGWDLINGRAIC